MRDGSLVAQFQTTRTPTFVNDVALLPNGDAIFSDSQSPVLYRVFASSAGELAFEEWLDLSGTAIQYQQGFNLNGIGASADGRYLVVVQSNTGRLFRIDTQTKTVSEIALAGEALTNGDGLLLEGRRLFVVRNRQELIVSVLLSEDLTSGTVEGSTTDPSFAYPTTIARAGNRLLVVNAQFDRRGPDLRPDLPFTVSSVPAP